MPLTQTWTLLDDRVVHVDSSDSAFCNICSSFARNDQKTMQIKSRYEKAAETGKVFSSQQKLKTTSCTFDEVSCSLSPHSLSLILIRCWWTEITQIGFPQCALCKQKWRCSKKWQSCSALHLKLNMFLYCSFKSSVFSTLSVFLPPKRHKDEMIWTFSSSQQLVSVCHHDMSGLFLLTSLIDLLPH